MDSTGLLVESKKVKKQASKLLKFIGIDTALRKYGSVNLVGSYQYNVMLKKDIDYHVVVKELNTNLLKDFFEYLIDSLLYQEIIFHDKHTFNKIAAERYASKKALDSYYFGLRIRYKADDWQIGINFITKRQRGSVEIEKMLKKMSDIQRKKILIFKNIMLERNLAVSSAYIYRAVLENNIHDESDLFTYLRKIGYKIKGFNKVY